MALKIVDGEKVNKALFYGNCSASILMVTEEQKLCTNCGSDGFYFTLQTKITHTFVGNNNFPCSNFEVLHCQHRNFKSDKWVGWVQNFITYKQMKGQEWSESVTKKAKEKGKGAIEPLLKKDADFIIYIGLVTWSEKYRRLKNKHGKRLTLRVNTKDSATTILQKAVSKWKAFYSDCYIEDEEYMLLLEDFQEAIFLPGSKKEFFTLKR